jgi:hypothetical protein
MASTLTLHDFLLSLLTDPQARAAFASDPAGALEHAGLGDITAEDMRDGIPLVLDYASAVPAAGLPGLPTAEPQAGLTEAIAELRSITARLPADDAPHVSGGAGASGGIGVTTPDGGFSFGGSGWYQAPDGDEAFDALRAAVGHLDSALPDPGALPIPTLPDLGALPAPGLPDLGALPAPGVPDLGALPINALPADPSAVLGELGSVVSDPTAAVGSLPGAGSLPSPASVLGTLPSGAGVPLPALPGVDGLPGVPAPGLPPLPALPAVPALPAADPSALDNSAHVAANAVDGAAHSSASAFDGAAHSSLNAFDGAAHSSLNAFDHATPLHQGVSGLLDNGLTSVVDQPLSSLGAVADHASAALPHIDDHLGL